MGHRANFIVIENGSANAYHDQWAALGCLHSFAAGPDDAVAMLADFETTTELMDWAFAEGGYLIDRDDRMAIVFGPWMDESDFDFDETDEPDDDEDVAEFDVAQYLADIAPAWTGWKLIFDDRGVDAFAEHLRAKQISSITTQPVSHPPDVKPNANSKRKVQITIA